MQRGVPASPPDSVGERAIAAPACHAGPVDAKQQTPEVASNGTAAADGQANQDMTAPELCAAFERQLLDLDDLAAFMGGGV